MRLYHAYNAFRLFCGVSVVLLILEITTLCGVANHKEYFRDLQSRFNEKNCSLKADDTTLFSLFEANVNISDVRLFLTGNGADADRTSHLMIFEWISGMLIVWATVLLIVHWVFFSSFGEFWSFLLTLMEFFVWNIAFYLTLLMHWRWHNIWTPADNFNFDLPNQVWLIEIACILVMAMLIYVLLCTEGVENRSLRLESTHRSLDLIENEVDGAGAGQRGAVHSISSFSTTSRTSAPQAPVLRRMGPISDVQTQSAAERFPTRHGRNAHHYHSLHSLQAMSAEPEHRRSLLPKGSQPPIIRRHPSKRSVLSYGSAKTAISLRNAPASPQQPKIVRQNSMSSNPPYPLYDNEIGWRVAKMAANSEQHHLQIGGRRSPANNDDDDHREKRNNSLANANRLIPISGNSLASSGGEPDFTPQHSAPDHGAVFNNNIPAQSFLPSNAQREDRPSILRHHQVSNAYGISGANALSSSQPQNSSQIVHRNLAHFVNGGSANVVDENGWRSANADHRQTPTHNDEQIRRNRGDSAANYSKNGVSRTSGNSLASSGGEPDFTSRSSGPDFTSDSSGASGGGAPPADQVYFHHNRQ